MAVKRSQNFLNQQRIDSPHLRSIESAVRSDFDELFTALILGETESYVIRGFEIEMAGSIGASANGLQMIVDNSSVLHGKSNESGTFFNVASGTANQVLSATTNTKVDGAFTPAALNYVSVEFVRQVDDTTTSQVYLWNPTTKNEITKTLPLAETLDYKIVISSSVFASNVLPIAIVETDSSNSVLSVQDRRPRLFGTGTAGTTTPDPFNEYGWADGRTPNFWSSSSSSVSPFKGGDKQIETFKDNDLAIKTEIKLMKGTQYWSSPNIGGSIAGLRYDLGNTILTGRGSISHDAGNAGQINWDEDVFLTVLSTRLKYKLEANAATTDIDLNDKQVAYIKIIRNEDIIPQLIFTNASAAISSVGAIAWTAGLEAGDFIKVASEEDTAYYQIQSIDSISQVTLTENFGGTSTGILGTDAKYAWGNYRTDAAPSTDRHIKVANVEDMPFDADTFWLFFRDDNSGISRIYLRFLNAELKQGETIVISDQVPAAVLAYMGSSSDIDADPNYITIATGGKTGTANYNSVQGENLTIRNAKLTSMMADKAQDKTIELVSDHTNVSNTTNVLLQDITMSGGSGIATVIMPSSANNGTIGTTGTLSLAANQAAYYVIDRNAAFNIANLGALTVADITTIPHDENTFIFAYRLANNTVYLWNGELLGAGTSIALSVLRGYVQQNKTVKLVKGGTWSWNSTNGILKNSVSAYIQVGGLAENVNEVAAQSITLDADGKCAYVTLKRVAGASVLTVSVADIAAVPSDDHTFIIARRTNADVIVGTSSFALKDDEFLELDGALAEINRYHGQLAITPDDPISTRVAISGSDIVKLSGSKLSLQQRNLLLDFGGAVIDFETGEVFESDGVTPFLGGANDFTPFSIGANEYFYYSISVLPNTTGADNTISGQVLVIPATASNAVLASAPKAAFSSIGINIANIYVQEDGASGILDIDYANITQLGVGAGGGSGTGLVKVTYHDPISSTLPTGATVTIDGQAGVDDDTVLFSNLSSGNNKIYKLSGVGSTISWEASLDFNLGIPEDGDTVIVTSGDSFRDSIGNFDSADWKFNDTVRYFSGSDYWEQSSLKTGTITNNSTNDIFSVNLTGSENIIVDYSLVRGTGKETGSVVITSDGTSVVSARYGATLVDTGVELFADINLGNIRFRYTADTAGMDGTIKYSVKRWSNSAGGPGGIPNYVGSGSSSTPAAGGLNEVQFKGSSGNLDADPNFKWNNANDSIDLNGLNIGVLSSGITLNDNQAVAAVAISYPKTNKFTIVKYSIERGNTTRVGRILIPTNGITVSFSDDFVEDGISGVIFSVIINAANVEIKYTSTSTGNAGTLKYAFEQWI